MGLAILLSIIQKNKSGGGAENEITALNNIGKQLERLSSIDDKLTSLDDVKKNTEILPLINTKLDSIDTNIKSLSSDISSFLLTKSCKLFKLVSANSFTSAVVF
jgi:hypothetical protein